MRLFLFAFIYYLLVGCAAKEPTPGLYELSQEEVDQIEFSGRLEADSIDFELLEFAIFNETNQQRERLGLPPFQFEQKLKDAAVQHTDEMIELGYFEHESPNPDYRTVTQRVEQAGIKNGMSGENLAKHPVSRKLEILFTDANSEGRSDKYKWRNTGSYYTYDEFAQELVSRWMQSPGHRSNITNRYFKYIGVGAAMTRIADIHVLYVTQNFSSLNY